MKEQLDRVQGKMTEDGDMDQDTNWRAEKELSDDENEQEERPLFD